MMQAGASAATAKRTGRTSRSLARMRTSWSLIIKEVAPPHERTPLLAAACSARLAGVPYRPEPPRQGDVRAGEETHLGGGLAHEHPQPVRGRDPGFPRLAHERRLLLPVTDVQDEGGAAGPRRHDRFLKGGARGLDQDAAGIIVDVL